MLPGSLGNDCCVPYGFCNTTALIGMRQDWLSKVLKVFRIIIMKIRDFEIIQQSIQELQSTSCDA